jgi:hypothetical protein
VIATTKPKHAELRCRSVGLLLQFREPGFYVRIQHFERLRTVAWNGMDRTIGTSG